MLPGIYIIYTNQQNSLNSMNIYIWIIRIKLIYVSKVDIFVLLFSYIIILVTEMNERVPMY